jgi:hypothetical protein
MPRQRKPSDLQGAVTLERAVRLCRLVQLIGQKPRPREELMRRLQLDVRSFYRDLVMLRAAGIDLHLRKRQYHLDEDLDQAVGRLPFPDPHLTLAQAVQVAKGRTPVHQKLRHLIEQVLEK